MINKIGKFINEHFIGLLITGAILLVIVLMNVISNDMEEHIERVSKECASQGYGITAKYTKEGDKYYVCDKSE